MAKLTKKQYVRRRIFAGVAIFAAVALITTGLTVWLLFNSLNAELGGGVIISGVATSPLSFQNLRLDNLPIEQNQPTQAPFVFAPKPGATGRVRGDGSMVEKLSVTVSGTVANAQYLSGLTFRLELPQGVIEAARKGYVDISAYYGPDFLPKTLPVNEVSTRYEVISDGAVSALHFAFTLNLGWGTAFANQNPSDYFDTEYYLPDGSADYSRGVHVAEHNVVQTMLDLYNTVGGSPGPSSQQANRYTLTLTADSN